jgi:WD40 repeat protein
MVIPFFRSSISNFNLSFLQGSEDLCVRGWDTRQSSKQPILHLTGFQYFPLCLSMDGEHYQLAAGCKGFNGVGCDVKLWDIRYLKQGKFFAELTGHQQDVTCCHFLSNHLQSDSSPTLLTASRDSSLRCWSTRLPTPISNGAFSDRSSYNCIDSWYVGEDQCWYCCLGDMDGAVSIVSISSDSESSCIEFRSVWKSTAFVSDENYGGEEG